MPEARHINPQLLRTLQEATGGSVADLADSAHPLARALADACERVIRAEEVIRDMAVSMLPTVQRLTEPVSTIDVFPPVMLLTEPAAQLAQHAAVRAAAWWIADDLIRAWPKAAPAPQSPRA